MRTVLSAALALVVAAAAAAGTPWRTAHPADSVTKPSAVSETWDLRAVEPNGRRAIVVRFWTKDNPYYIEWLWYRRGRGVASYTERVEFRQHVGPGVSMKEPFGHGSIRHAGARWLLDAYGSTSRSRAKLVLHAVRPGLTVGPLPASGGRSAWLSIVATGLVDGVVETPNGTVRLRKWYGAHVHEWASFRHHETQAYVRQDLALLWRSARDLRLVWGLEPFRTPKQTHTPDDSIWRGISARLGARRSACTPRVRRTGLERGALTYAQPTTRLAARCRGSTRRPPFRRQDRRDGLDLQPDLHRARHIERRRRRLSRADDPRYVGRSHSTVPGFRENGGRAVPASVASAARSRGGKCFAVATPAWP